MKLEKKISIKVYEKDDSDGRDRQLNTFDKKSSLETLARGSIKTNKVFNIITGKRKYLTKKVLSLVIDDFNWILWDIFLKYQLTK